MMLCTTSDRDTHNNLSLSDTDTEVWRDHTIAAEQLDSFNMGLLKKLGLKKPSKQKEGEGIDVTTANAPEPDISSNRPNAPERHVEPPKPRLDVPTIAQPADQKANDGDNQDDDDEVGIEIGEVETEEEEGNHASELDTRQKALKTNISQDKEIYKPQAELGKKVADDRVAQMFAKQKQDDESKAKNLADARVAEMFEKQKQIQAKERVAQTFHSQNQNDTARIEKDFGYKPQNKGTADERVAQMFAKSKPNNDNKPNIVGAHKLDAEERLAEMRLASKSSTEAKQDPVVGKACEQKKAVEAMLQKQLDPKAFLDSKKGSTKIEILTASSEGLSFAERRKLAEAMSQRQVAANEPKHMVDVSHEHFGDKSSFAQRRKMLEAKSQGQKAQIMDNTATGAQFNSKPSGSPETQYERRERS
ncbi:hypothetical protein ACHAXM_006104 [Skeletonema potamos]